jgi:hypothetical protein
LGLTIRADFFMPTLHLAPMMLPMSFTLITGLSYNYRAECIPPAEAAISTTTLHHFETPPAQFPYERSVSLDTDVAIPPPRAFELYLLISRLILSTSTSYQAIDAPFTKILSESLIILT